jgi:hypothetical protein
MRRKCDLGRPHTKGGVLTKHVRARVGDLFDRTLGGGDDCSQCSLFGAAREGGESEGR